VLLLNVRYTDRPTLILAVPDMGLSPGEWARAVFTATHVPSTLNYGIPGALEVAAAIANTYADTTTPAVRPLAPGDVIEGAGRSVTCLTVTKRGDGWGVGDAAFSDPDVIDPPVGPRLHVGPLQPPPDAIAYAEDIRDRLWTGKGFGPWRCLTDPAGRTSPGMWAAVWREHGPLTPLVPVEPVTV
jgi:hypothetical protein